MIDPDHFHDVVDVIHVVAHRRRRIAKCAARDDLLLPREIRVLALCGQRIDLCAHCRRLCGGRDAKVFAQFRQRIGTDLIAFRILLRVTLHVRIERHELNHAAVFPHRADLLVVEIAAVIADRTHAAVAGNDRRLRQFDGLQHRRFRRMRDVDHHAKPVHLADYLLAKRRESIPAPDTVALAGVGIGELTVPVVRQRHVAPAAFVELADVGDVCADREAILDADENGLAAAGVNGARLRSGCRQSYACRRELLGQTMDRIELFERRSICLRERRTVKFRRLTDVHDQEGAVETTLFHLCDVDLRARQLRRVVDRVGAEVRRIDVDVCVDGHHALVDAAGAGDHVSIRCRRRARARRATGQQRERKNQDSLRHVGLIG